jgi:hypothetical protein
MHQFLIRIAQRVTKIGKIKKKNRYDTDKWSQKLHEKNWFLPKQKKNAIDTKAKPSTVAASLIPLLPPAAKGGWSREWER